MAEKKNADRVLYYQGLPYMPEIVRTKLISRYHNNPLAGYFGINKTRELIAQKYYWPTLCHNVKAYMTGCNICLTLKAVRHKPYDDFKSLTVSRHQ